MLFRASSNTVNETTNCEAKANEVVRKYTCPKIYLGAGVCVGFIT